MENTSPLSRNLLIGHKYIFRADAPASSVAQMQVLSDRFFIMVVL
ncbi:hypothetical protein [Nostoc flagelliforme]|nr:hypothetical protein [Nostoc flagelliforme]